MHKTSDQYIFFILFKIRDMNEAITSKEDKLDEKAELLAFTR